MSQAATPAEINTAFSQLNIGKVTEGKEEQIRLLAQSLWEKGGRPEGRDPEIWEIATRFAAVEKGAEAMGMTSILGTINQQEYSAPALAHKVADAAMQIGMSWLNLAREMQQRAQSIESKPELSGITHRPAPDASANNEAGPQPI